MGDLNTNDEGKGTEPESQVGAAVGGEGEESQAEGGGDNWDELASILKGGKEPGGGASPTPPEGEPAGGDEGGEAPQPPSRKQEGVKAEAESGEGDGDGEGEGEQTPPEGEGPDAEDLQTQPQNMEEWQRQQQYMREHVEKQVRDYFSKEFAVPEDQVEALQAEPEKVLPELMTNMAMKVRELIIAEASRAIPQMAVNATLQHVDSQRTEDKFYEKFPALKKKEYQEDIIRMAQSFAQSSHAKGADLDTRMKAIGTAVSLMHGLPLPEGVGQQEKQGAAQANGQQPAPQTKEKGEGSEPFHPVRAAGVGSAQPRKGAGSGQKTELDEMWDDIAPMFSP